eukprot:3997576-Pyramimonas_sp.AAC.1
MPKPKNDVRPGGRTKATEKPVPFGVLPFGDGGVIIFGAGDWASWAITLEVSSPLICCIPTAR